MTDALSTNIVKITLHSILTILFLFVVLLNVGMAQTGAASNSPDAIPQLTPAQLQSIKSIRSATERKAAPLAIRLAATVRRVYENMLSDKEDEALRKRLSSQMNEVASQLLAIKGQSIREIVRVLTPEQRSLIRSEMKKPGAPADLSELIMHVFKVPEK